MIGKALHGLGDATRTRWLLAACVVTLSALGAWSAPAGAATVTFTSPNEDLVRDTLEYAAAPGERNQLSVRLQGGAYALRERGVPLSAGAGCRLRSPDVLCDGATADQNPAVINLGDRNDSATIAVFGINVLGGPGNDTLVVARNARPGFVDAATPNDGDGLLGGNGNDRLYGGANDDSLDAGRGNDLIVTGGGRNDVNGGAGNDVIYSTNHRTDTVRCGSGHDTAYADRKDKLSGCESVHRY
jgi:Ca2+-binding RTX toxin-like protein